MVRVDALRIYQTQNIAVTNIDYYYISYCNIY